MNYEVRLAAEAQTTIAAQLAWYTEDAECGGERLARRWLEALELAVGKLSTRPERHGMAPENGRWHPEVTVRQFQFRPWRSRAGWRVLFAIDDSRRIVTVLQVRHEKRRFLFEREERT